MPTALIVEDSETLNAVGAYMLETLGFQTLSAKDGVEALKICSIDLPDVILLDWEMPVMDGPTFQDKLREIPFSDQVKVFFCTRKDEFKDIARAMSGGAESFIIKPLTIDTLRYNLERAGVLPTPLIDSKHHAKR